MVNLLSTNESKQLRVEVGKLNRHCESTVDIGQKFPLKGFLIGFFHTLEEICTGGKVDTDIKEEGLFFIF